MHPMSRSYEQRLAVDFCVRIGKSAEETYPMLKTAYGDDCFSEHQIIRWHKSFLHFRRVRDEARAKRLLKTNTDENVNEFLRTDGR